MKHKIDKILITVLIILSGILINTVVQAKQEAMEGENIEFSELDVEKNSYHVTLGDMVNGSYVPHEINGDMTYCIQHGKGYKADVPYNLRRWYEEHKQGTYQGYIKEEKVNEDNQVYEVITEYKPPEYNQGKIYYGMKYEMSGQIDIFKHQDVAYILAWANSTNNMYNKDTQWAIWTTDLNSGRDPIESDEMQNKEQAKKLAKEAEIFKDFYATIHDNDGRNIFQSLVRNLTTEAKVAVNSDGSYIVGPFKMAYPNGQFDGINKFSWITSIVGITDNGEVPVTILSELGDDITNKIGKDGNVSLNNQNFYIKFKDTSAKTIRLKIKFGYLESCYAELYRYIGRKTKWYWVPIEENVEYTTNIKCGGNLQEKRVTVNGKIYYIYTCDKCGHVISSTIQRIGDGLICNELTSSTKKVYKYRLTIEETEILRQETIHTTKYIKKEWSESDGSDGSDESGGSDGTGDSDGSSSSGQMVYAQANYGTATIEMGLDIDNDDDEEDIDLTMTISGTVFLDNDTGKVNEGNEKYDPGEELGGIEVRLYDSNNTLIGIKLTDSNGYYEFTELNPLKKYFVRFTYNGMLYTNVTYKQEEDRTSKATEEARGHSNSRQNFNNKFGTIGSYPSNYKTTDCITGEVRYNKTYLQEDIVWLFKEVAKYVVRTNGDEKAAYQAIIYDLVHNNEHANENEIRQKVQFVADCRINAYTVKSYPIKTSFVIDSNWLNIGNEKYLPLYGTGESQKNVNLGIKARPTFDMAIYKDVLNAKVQLNEKTEIYKYDSRKDSANGFTVGISERNYLNKLREAYSSSMYGLTYLGHTRDIETDVYNLNMRPEDIVNGEINTNISSDKYQVVDNYNNLAVTNRNDRLEMYITYKIAVRNQSSIVGAITELVDYYDTNYKFVEAYVGDEKGNKIGDVTTSNTSIYGNEYKSNKNSYNTIYLRPNVEQRLDESEEQYIYVKLQLLGPDNDVGTLLSQKLLFDEKLNVINIVEINGYKTYNSKTGDATPGLIDIDSNPGNFNISNIDALTQENIVNYPNIKNMYEDDTSRAPVLVYSLYDSRTIEGTVFEDKTGKTNSVYTAQSRKGNGKLDSNDKKIAGVIVELIEIKDNQMIVRGKTTTNSEGWYGFIGYLPGNYTIRYTYGADDATAMTTSSTWYKGDNATSYNGQDYQSTIFEAKAGKQITSQSYTTDGKIIERYREYDRNKTLEESVVPIRTSTIIDKYDDGYYWYTQDDKKSDARDDEYRKGQVIEYSTTEYGKEIVNHKAEVFNAYVNPQPTHITQEYNRTLANELERRTYRYAYTPEMNIEVEYATTTTNGNEEHVHRIKGIDFGIVERPKSELTIDQDVKRIKVTAAGVVLFDTETGTNNLQWIAKGDINKYDKKELINIIMDEELINGAKLEITYNITVKNNGEKDEDSTTKAKAILNYVSNNLNFEVESNKDANGNPLWQVVPTNLVQRAGYATYVNNTMGTNRHKLIDLSTQAVILQTTDTNPLVTTDLLPGQQVTTTLKLEKILSAEGTTDDLKYTNLTEIVEIDNTLGRYDHGAVPGNQNIELQPQEHDTSGASKSAALDGNQDGTVIVTPPTGSKYIYYVIGITSLVILASGIYFIKKYVIKK